MRLIWSPEEFPCFTLICFAIPVQRAEMQHWQSFGGETSAKSQSCKSPGCLLDVLCSVVLEAS